MLVELAVLLVLVIIVASGSAAEAASAKLNRGRIRHLSGEGASKPRPILTLLDHVAPLEITIAIANSLVISLAAITLVLVSGRVFGFEDYTGYLIVLLGLAILVWIQIGFRIVGAQKPESVLSVLRVPVATLRILLAPVALLMMWATRIIFHGEYYYPRWRALDVEDELRMIVDAAEQNGALEEEEKEMIEGIVTLGERTAHEIMVPRVDVAAVEASEPLSEVLETIKSRGHSRVPIYEETIDNIVGIVHAKELLRHMEDGALDQPARSLARPPYFIPESKKIDELLREMQRGKVHMAIVVDEYGGTAGVVTIEDLLEEIVGEIQDEYDVDEKLIETVNDREAVFDSRVSIHDVNETLDTALANGEYDTIGGLVYHHLGKMPVVGDEITMDGVSIEVLSVAGKRIKKVKVSVAPDSFTESRNVAET